MFPPKIQSVQPLDDKQLLVSFENGYKKVYDCKQLLQKEPFKLLSNVAFFRAVQVDPGGYGISWNEDIDLSEYELWVNGKEVTVSDKNSSS